MGNGQKWSAAMLAQNSTFFVKVPKHVLPLYRWAGVVGVVNSMDGVFVLLHGLKMEYGNVNCQKVYKFLL